MRFIHLFIYLNDHNAETVTAPTLAQHCGLDIPPPTHLIFIISIVGVGQVQRFNLMTDDKVLTPC